MAWLTSIPRPREQYTAILQARWLMFVHSLRSKQGSLELISRIFYGALGAILGIGGAFGFGFAAYYFSLHQHLENLAFLLWPVMLFWQFFPVIGTTFSGNLDSRSLVRFPLSYRSYYFIQLIEGLAGPASVVPGLWLLGMILGVGVGRPALLFPAIVILATFGAVNLLFSRMVLSWVERWMEQRRTREIFIFAFFLLMMCMQFLGPAIQHLEGKQRQVSQVARQFATMQKPLPPGAAAQALVGVANGDIASSVLYFSALAAYCAAFFALLGIRLKAQYRGENLSEVAAGRTGKTVRRLTPGWNLLGLPGPMAAIFQKEIRYLLRSGQMLIALVSPILVLFVFGAQSKNGGGNPLGYPSVAFPVGAALALLSVTNLFQNSFGGDGGGLQLLFAAPVKFRQIMLGRNIAHAVVFSVEISIIWFALALMGRFPSAKLATGTFISVLFALVAQAILGNLLSLYLPRKFDFGKFNRQQTSAATVLLGIGANAAIYGICGLLLYLSSRNGAFWVAILILLLLTGIAGIGYFTVINQVDKIAMSRREQLIAEICKA